MSSDLKMHRFQVLKWTWQRNLSIWKNGRRLILAEVILTSFNESDFENFNEIHIENNFLKSRIRDQLNLLF